MSEMPERIFARDYDHSWGYGHSQRQETTEYIRADIVAARDKWIDDKVTVMLSDDRAKDARIEFLEKALEQAVRLANIRVELIPEAGDEEGEGIEYVYYDYCGTPFMSTLAAYLRERDSRPPAGGEA